MNVHLTPRLRKLIEREVATGRYASASEVVQEGLRLFVEERRWREAARRKIAQGLAQARTGKFVSGHVVAKRLKQRIAAHRKRAS